MLNKPNAWIRITANRDHLASCGIFSAVCSRGVLKLENGETKGRYNLD